MYAKNELVILDDVFSGLDADTEERIFSRLFSKDGLFRQMETTVILATHAVSRLAYSDHIVALGSTGRILQQGSYQELKLTSGYVQGLDTAPKSDGSPKVARAESTTIPVEARIFSADEDEIETEELNRQTGDFQVYKYYFASIGWLNFSIFISLCILEGTSVKLTEFLLIYCKLAQVLPFPSRLKTAGSYNKHRDTCGRSLRKSSQRLLPRHVCAYFGDSFYWPHILCRTLLSASDTNDSFVHAWEASENSYGSAVEFFHYHRYWHHYQ